MANVFLHDQTNRFVSEVGNNGRITVTCPSGCNITAQCGDTVYEKTADDTGRVVFAGLTQGQWSVEVRDGNQVITKNVEVITDYEVDMEFITAVIRIDYPHDYVCTCTNDIVKYEAHDTSGHWDCTVANLGTWTISCTNGERTEVRTVEITNDGQVETVELIAFEAVINAEFPIDAVCTCSNGLVHYITPDYSNATTIANVVHKFTIPDPGTWTLTCINGDRTETRVVDVSADGQTESVTFVFFEAVLDITYSAGYPCTCTMGTNVLTAPDTSGRWTCVIPESGKWTVSCTDGENIKSETVNVTTDGSSQAVNIAYFLAVIDVLYPEGDACTIELNGKTYGAPDTSGKWTFKASETGDCNVTCVTSSGTKNKTVNISRDWQTEYVNLTGFMSMIDISYPAGAECKCSDGRTTYRAENASGRWLLSVPRTGTWTITATNSEQEVSASVTISADGQTESITIKFFAATINISYPSGAVCTCTDGTFSYTAPTTSGSWKLTVPRTGEWLIRAVNGNQNISESVVVSYDGQIISKTIKFFEAYINVNYPSGSNKVVLYSVDSYGSKNEYAVDTSGDGSHRFTVLVRGEYEVAVYRVAPYAGIESDSSDYATAAVTISNAEQSASVTLKYYNIPEFTYSGNYKLIDDYGNPLGSEDSADWCISFLTTGVLKFTKLHSASKGIDVFVCGGGGNGGSGDYADVEYPYTIIVGGGGGGGGYHTTSFDEKVEINKSYTITIGGTGGTSSAFAVTANGGSNGEDADNSNDYEGGKGGSGGSFGGNGATGRLEQCSNGEDGSYAFMSNLGKRYGPGGAGGRGYFFDCDTNEEESSPVYKGGSDGGGGNNGNLSQKSADANSGGGGGGGGLSGSSGVHSEGGTGGSGIVIIRNKR